ncbi:hypothetical protein P4S63_01295 [Pseudoalteromonas sp. B193]
MQQWLIRKKQFKVLARVAVSQSLILNSSKVGIGYFSPLGLILVILATLGNALYAFQLWICSIKQQFLMIGLHTKKYTLSA